MSARKRIVVINDTKEGWQLLQTLRMLKATANVPIIACTAAVRQVHESEAYLLEQGIEVVLKPLRRRRKRARG